MYWCGYQASMMVQSGARGWTELSVDVGCRRLRTSDREDRMALRGDKID